MSVTVTTKETLMTCNQLDSNQRYTSTGDHGRFDATAFLRCLCQFRVDISST